jgi:hypothetical protein
MGHEVGRRMRTYSVWEVGRKSLVMGYAELIIQFLLSRFEKRFPGRGELKYTASPFSLLFCLRLLPGCGLSGNVVTFEKCAINGKNC